LATVNDVYCEINRKAPFSLQEGFDNAGFLVGHGNMEVHQIVVSLDITRRVIEEAVGLGAELIVSHHPVIFNAQKSITGESGSGRTLLALIEHQIAAICAHTNLDAVRGGVNDCLAAALNLCEVDQLHTSGIDQNGSPYGIGRVGRLSGGGMPFMEFAGMVKRALRSNGLRYVDTGKPVVRVAVGGGSCGNMLSDAIACGCDTFVTSDIKYDTFLDAEAAGINLIDAGHFPTENIVCPVLAGWLREAFPSVAVTESAVHREVISYL